MRSAFIFSLVFIAVSGHETAAQCPGGKPALPGGECPSRNPLRSSCSILIEIIEKDGGEANGIFLKLNGSLNNYWRTNERGKFIFRRLSCRRSYTVTPARQDYSFDPPSFPIESLKGQAKVSFTATPRREVEPLPIQIPPTSICNPPASNPPEIIFGNPIASRIGSQTSECDQQKEKVYFNDYLLKGAVGGDIIHIEVRSPEASILIVQVIDKEGQSLNPEGHTATVESQIHSYILPEAFDYQVRITGTQNSQSDYQLSVIRKGLTDEAYKKQIALVNSTINGAGEGATNFFDSLNYQLDGLRSADNEIRVAADHKLKTTYEILERLAAIDSDNVQAHEMLSVIHQYYRKDSRAAAHERTLALQLNGEVRFRVRMGDDLFTAKGADKIERNREDCWLKIKDGIATCESLIKENGEIFQTTPGLLEKSRLTVSRSGLALKIYGTRKYFLGNDNGEARFETRAKDQFLIPLSDNKDETAAIHELILKLLEKK
ncbi:MAG: hypothetical protein L0226_03595 [Acidobacteria bacterium]|nr:hypothetical protein [Acidobacteriota bacterium]